MKTMSQMHLNIEQIENLPVTAMEIARETKRNPMLSCVYQHVTSGWKKPEDTSLMPFYNCRDEITTQHGCLMWGIRVINPTKFRKKILETLHASHLGVVKMRGIARIYVWWPGIDKEIENVTKSCSGSSKIQNNPTNAPVHPWEWPSANWQRIHTDFAGPFLNKNFLIMVDAHSKWPEVFPMKKKLHLKQLKFCVQYSRETEFQNRLCRTTDHSLRHTNFTNSLGKMELNISNPLHIDTKPTENTPLMRRYPTRARNKTKRLIEEC